MRVVESRALRDARSLANSIYRSSVVSERACSEENDDTTAVDVGE